ncbi:phage repressor protein C with HTH and peptisase S24 domain [Saccharothrix tamanrassetensis]|uniref:Phage repressor protein C with HTH and peptisase S24 domain n=1 Tax=Saccharothrix tamanrassetensis TaxID=1051531 RepID=A0A841CD84_9PSEU|nr:S24 family peptidase [Saccharothrix tamanrassetensis]MBB5955211.1 phage repressor protein C with HTH and peptisase S24 domain [Saccharothrix tamanrassetensis]
MAPSRDESLPLVRVVGPSMFPTLRTGDVVTVERSRTARENDLVLVRWEARPGQLSVKRAVREVDGGWHVEGDNPFASTDSRTLGAAEVLGVIRFRLWPRPRRLR